MAQIFIFENNRSLLLSIKSMHPRCKRTHIIFISLGDRTFKIPLGFLFFFFATRQWLFENHIQSFTCRILRLGVCRLLSSLARQPSIILIPLITGLNRSHPCQICIWKKYYTLVYNLLISVSISTKT